MNNPPNGHEFNSGHGQSTQSDTSIAPISCDSRSSLGLSIEEINMLYSPTAESLAFDFSPSDFSVNGGLMSSGSIMSVPMDSVGAAGVNHTGQYPFPFAQGKMPSRSDLEVYGPPGHNDEVKWSNVFEMGEIPPNCAPISPQGDSTNKEQKKKKTKKKKPPSVFNFDGFSSSSGTEDISPSRNSTSYPSSSSTDTNYNFEDAFTDHMKQIVENVVSAEMEKRGLNGDSGGMLNSSVTDSVRSSLAQMNYIQNQSPFPQFLLQQYPSVPDSNPQFFHNPQVGVPNANILYPNLHTTGKISDLDDLYFGQTDSNDFGMPYLESPGLPNIAALETLSLQSFYEMNSDSNDDAAAAADSAKATAAKPKKTPTEKKPPKEKKEKKSSKKASPSTAITDGDTNSSTFTIKPVEKPVSKRTSNSLSALAVRFVQHYGNENTIKYISAQVDEREKEACEGEDEADGISDRVDGAAETLAVHVRRIYELIKILEILSLVTFSGGKRGKFTWKGTKTFMLSMGILQAEAMVRYPDISRSTGLNTIQHPTASSPKGLPMMQSAAEMLFAIKAEESPTSSPDGRSFNPSTYDGATTDTGAMSINSSTSPANTDGGLDSSSAAVHSFAFWDSASSKGSDSTTTSANTHVAKPVVTSANTHVARPVVTSGSILCPGNTTTRPPIHGGMVIKSDKGAHLESLSESCYDSNLNPNPVDPGRTITPKPKVGADGSFSKKRSKEATPRKITKTKADGSTAGNAATEPGDHMLENMCKHFMMLFLAGMNSISMSSAVHALIPIGENETNEEYNKKYATKIRRVYDVANVLCSLNILQKIYIPRPQEEGVKAKKEPKTDIKVLRWKSFPPLVIRDHYVNRL